MSDEGFGIQFDESSYKETNEITIQGRFTIYVNCGSQYAVWYQFPGAVIYTLKDLDSGETYQSINRELSISWSGNQVYDEYAKMPCDQVVEKGFSIALNDIRFITSPEVPISNFELQAAYIGRLSNRIQFANSPFFIKRFGVTAEDI